MNRAMRCQRLRHALRTRVRGEACPDRMAPIPTRGSEGIVSLSRLANRPMTFSLSTPLEELIRRKVNSGQYDSPSQVIEEALQLLEERDLLRDARRDRLLREVAGGLLEADNRQLVESAEVFRGMVNKASVSDE